MGAVRHRAQAHDNAQCMNTVIKHTPSHNEQARSYHAHSTPAQQPVAHCAWRTQQPAGYCSRFITHPTVGKAQASMLPRRTARGARCPRCGRPSYHAPIHTSMSAHGPCCPHTEGVQVFGQQIWGQCKGRLVTSLQKKSNRASGLSPMRLRQL